MPQQFVRNNQHTLEKILISPSLDLRFVEKDQNGNLNIFEQRLHRQNQTAFNLTSMTSLYTDLWTYVLSNLADQSQQYQTKKLKSEDIVLLENKVQIIPQVRNSTWMI